MKRINFLLTVLFVALSATAQYASFGVKAGYSLALAQEKAVNDNFSIRSDMQNGLHVGVFARFGRTVFIQPEVNYNFYVYNQGFTEDAQLIPPAEYRAHTIEVPVLLGVSVVNTHAFKLRFMAGPKFSCDVGSKAPPSQLQNYTEDVRKTRLGLDCGIGIDAWRMILEVRYNLMQSLFKYAGPDKYDVKKDPTHNSFVVSLGFRIAGDNILR